MQTALNCPCRYLWENLLAVRPLPEIAAGLTPQERGARLHKVLERFVRGFQKVLKQQGNWDQGQGRSLLREAVAFHLSNLEDDLHWQAERQRWLGEDEDVPGLLWEWLRLEQERFQQGWRWQGVETEFQGLGRPDWAFTLQGRIDRVDYHPEAGLMVWDYKSGEVPKAKKVFQDEQEFQLPGYLLAVKQGLLPIPAPAGDLRAGFIGLKSIRREHLKHEDFKSSSSDWQRLVDVWAEKVADISRLLLAGNFSPRPHPPPSGKELGACQYCPYALICGYQVASEAEGEDADSEEL
jgi:RecB family exonuclease